MCSVRCKTTYLNDNSATIHTTDWHDINLQTMGFCCFKEQQNKWLLSGETSLHVLCGPGRRGKVTSFEARGSARYVELTITGESLSDHRKHGTHRTFRRTAFTLRPLTDLQSVITNKRRVPISTANTEHKRSKLGEYQATHKLIGTNTCFSLLITLKDHH